MARVLVVDDANFVRIMMKTALLRDGHEIVGEAADGNEAVAKYKELKPDITLLDITMPETDGIQALKEILEFDPNAKVIMVPAMGQHAITVEAIVAGAKNFVMKPFTADNLNYVIQEVLNK